MSSPTTSIYATPTPGSPLIKLIRANSGQLRGSLGGDSMEGGGWGAHDENNRGGMRKLFNNHVIEASSKGPCSCNVDLTLPDKHTITKS